MRLADSERRIMELLWKNGEMTAREIAATLQETIGWSKTTTYTMLTRCGNKKYLAREDPHFRCRPLITQEEVSQWETDELLKNNFSGSADLLVASLVGHKKLSLKQLETLYQTLQEMEEK